MSSEHDHDLRRPDADERVPSRTPRARRRSLSRSPRRRTRSGQHGPPTDTEPDGRHQRRRRGARGVWSGYGRRI